MNKVEKKIKMMGMWMKTPLIITKNGESVIHKFIYKLIVTWADGIHITFVSVTALSVCYLSPFLPYDKNRLICLVVNVTFLAKLKKKKL